MSVHKKIQPNRSSRLAGYREHIYECLVLLYRLVERNILSVWVELLMYFVNFLFFYVYFFQETQIKEERKGVMCSSFQKIKWIWIQNEILIRISEKKLILKEDNLDSVLSVCRNPSHYSALLKTIKTSAYPVKGVKGKRGKVGERENRLCYFLFTLVTRYFF